MRPGEATSSDCDLRAGPPDEAGSDAALNEVLEATRELLWIDSPTDAAAIGRELVASLGGWTVPAAHSGSEAIPVDCSFGQGEPVLPTAPPGSSARGLLERHIPLFVRDANRALELTERTYRLSEDAAIDALTGLANRRMLGRAIGRLRPEDTVVMIDLDHFKAVNDTMGHEQGDAVLRALGRTLASTVRARDLVGRYGGEEFVVILAENGAEPFLRRLRSRWAKARPHPVTFSAGIAPARPNPPGAIRAADRAMYRAKDAGRDRWRWACEEDYI